MSWLSKSFGLILLTFLLTIWASSPRWEKMASDVAKKMNVTDETRIDEAWKAAISVDTQLHDYFYRKLAFGKKSSARGVLDSAQADMISCIERFYNGEQEERFKDCVRHVLDLHLVRLKAFSDKSSDGRGSSGASRLQVWQW
uniref:Uncharacterized protein LOC108048744 n=1 Tax=Drosophila rhopaloa TaxID=1041015 RepID=A0A6P4F7N3_DRORH